MDRGRGDTGVSGSDGELMQIGNHVARRVKAGNRGLLVRIDLEAANLIAARAERGGEIGAHVAAEHRIEHVEPQALAVAQHGLDAVVAQFERNRRRGGERL